MIGVRFSIQIVCFSIAGVAVPAELT